MKIKLTFVFALFFLCQVSFGEENGEKNDAPRDMVFPSLSYKYVSFDGLKYHEPQGGAVFLRINPAERGDMFMASASYSPRIVTEIKSGFPDLYHGASLMLMRKHGRDMFNGVFNVMSEEPLSGGPGTIMAMAGYSRDFFEGRNFQADLGAVLLVFDIGLELDNGMPWMFFPLPSFDLSWDYGWIDFGLGLPRGARMTIGPASPLSLAAAAGPGGLDAVVWLKFFRDNNSSAEIWALGIGVRSETARLNLSSGYRYGVKYNALYCGIRLFRFIEINAGYAFSGAEEYRRADWTAMLESMNMFDGEQYKKSSGPGYFFSVSFRMLSR